MRGFIFPTSFAQQRLWFLDRYERNSAFYNIPMALRLQGKLDVASLSLAFNELVRRHETLRTVFGEKEGTPYQLIVPELTLELPLEDLSALEEESRKQEARRRVKEEAAKPFDLAKGPLIRVGLLRLGELEHVLLLTLHHIVSDGWSMGVLFREVATLYEAFAQGKPSPLAELAIQYADYAHWQRQWLQGEVLEGQVNYWKEQLAGAPALLELPTDRPRLALQSYRGATLRFGLPKELTGKLNALAREKGVTLFMLMAAAFKALLHRYTGQEDICIGTAVANRRHAQLEGLIGFFVNTLVLRTKVQGEESFDGLLKRVQETALGAYAHQDLPFEKLVEELNPPRSLSHAPLFQVMLILQNAPRERIESKELSFRAMGSDARVSKFDLTCFLTEGAQRLFGTFEYNTDLFDRATMERLAKHYEVLLEGICQRPQAQLKDLPLLTQEEKHQLLVEWNATEASYPKDKTVHELFEEQVQRSPQATALVFEGEQLSYEELNARANRLAHYLREQGVGPEVLVGICVERSLEMVVGLLGILKAGGAYVPLDPAYPKERLAYMLEDAAPKVLLTQERLVATLPSQEGTELFCLDRDEPLLAAHPQTNPTNHTRSENLVYVIYTSGSTGKPKGVCIPHQGVVRLVKGTNYVSLTSEEIFLQLAPLSFDASTFEIWGCILNGGQLVVFTPYIPSLAQLGLALRKHHITTLWLTANLFQQVVEEQCESLANVRQVLAGGDVLPVSHVKQLLKQPGSCRLINGYGPTESATFACCYQMVSPDQIGATVPIGRPIANTQVYVLDAYQNPVPVGVSGELYIGGDGVGRGYLNRPELTAQKFIGNPFSEDPKSRLYKTGDLARYLPDGNLEYLGRIDHQVKIRGFRIELGEIEATLLESPGVTQAVVQAREDEPGDKRLVAYVVPETGEQLELEALRAGLKKKLPEYMVPSAFVVLEGLPLTPNGKVDRKALPAPDGSRQTSKEYVAPRTPLEQTLADIWAQVLKVDQVGIHDNFFELGGHSLLAVQAVSRLRSELKAEYPLRLLFEHPTVGELAGQIEQGGGAQEALLPAIARASRENDLPLSFAQQRLWFLDRYERNSAFYNIPMALRLQGKLDVASLSLAFNELVRRHETLRTVFGEKEGTPYQLIVPELTLELPLEDLSALEEESRKQEARRRVKEEAAKPFDLAKGPLIRVGLLRLGELEHVLLLTLHHIVSDGWSMGVLFREVATLYEAFAQGKPSPLAELAIQYADYAHWQRQWLQGEVLEGQVNYWKEQLAGAPALLELPTDRPRLALQSYRGATLRFGLPKELTGKLNALAREKGVTLFMLMAAAFKALLHRYTGQEDICIGTAVANRRHAQLEGLIGFFVNTLVLRTKVQGEESFDGLLKRVQETALGAYAHQDLPFEKLVEELNPPRSLSHAPLFQVMLILQNAPRERIESKELSFRAMGSDARVSKFDLTCFLTEGAQRLFGTFEYNTDLFDRATMERLAKHYEVLLEGICQRPQAQLKDLPLLTQEEKHQLLVEWNATEASYPKDKTVHELFEEQVQRSPQATALVFEGEQLSYEELNARANRLAHYLREQGVGPEVLVGICVERSLEMVVGLLGILKAGGAYVPLDPAYPKERLAYMLEDAAPKVLLTQERLVATLPSQEGTELFCLDRDEPLLAAHPQTNPTNHTRSENLVYVIYTSGSTGKPKGVQIQHGNVANFLESMGTQPGVAAKDVLLSVTSLSFDIAGLEICLPLTRGARLELVSRETAMDAARLTKAMGETRPSVMQATPSTWRMLEEHGWSLEDRSLRVLCGGEALPKDLAERLLKRAKGGLWNLYGPTETTIWSSYACIGNGDSRISIGRPIANTQLYILDAYGNAVPAGVSGELYIGGDGVGRGYLNRPELTAERFVADPFSEKQGARLYKTGDLARYLPDGNLEYLGRLDHQVKIRGFRVELGEIEATLLESPAVTQAVVLAREDEPGDKRLVAYVAAPKEQLKHALKRDYKESRDEMVARWEAVWDDTYATNGVTKAPSFTGWNSSFTGKPIPEAEMREWLECTVERIKDLKPKRALEIGCGVGLVLEQVAPHCQAYRGTDVSQSALSNLGKWIESHDALRHAELSRQPATSFDNLEPGSIDTVILNSVAQYFPDIDYLVSVIAGAIERSGENGHIYIGDLRHFGLMPAFRASLLLGKAAPHTKVAELKLQLTRVIEQEKELLIDPGFFMALKEQLPRIGDVRALLKRSRYDNELTRYRYDVVLDLDETRAWAVENVLEWKDTNSIADLNERLSRSVEAIQIRGVPNVRMARDAATLKLIQTSPNELGVKELTRLLNDMPELGEDPCLFWELGETKGYDVRVTWAPNSRAGHFDVLMGARTRGALRKARTSRRDPTSAVPRWSSHANDPLAPTFRLQLVSDLKQALGNKLPEYMVPSAFVVLEGLPLTPNGKVDRKALPAPDGSRQTSKEYVAPRTPLEQTLADIWAQVLKVDQVGIHDNFFELGGHSLLAVQAVSRLRSELKAEYPLRLLFEHPTVGELAGQIEQGGGAQEALLPAIARASRENDLPLSFAQQRLWFLDRYERNSAFYNIPMALRLQGKLDVASLSLAFNELVRRHETLRTVFGEKEGTPYQLIVPELTLELPLEDLSALEEESRKQEARRRVKEEAAKPFDLAKGPLIRVGLLRLGELEHVLLLTLHHIVSDGWSMGVLFREVATLYEAFAQGKPSPLAELAIQYADYAHWQRQWLQGEVLEGQVNYWKEQLAGAPALLELPTDRPRLALQSYRGATLRFGLPKELTGKLNALAREKGVTLFMLMAAAFKALLHRYTGQEDICIGTAVANRRHAQLEGLIGFFVNTLVLRTKVQGEESFDGLLKRVQETALGAYAHQDLPFEKLVEELNPPRSLSHAPLFQVMLILQNAPRERIESKELSFRAMGSDARVSKFDLTCFLTEGAQRLFGTFEYNTDLFDRATMERLAKHYEVLLEGICQRPQAQLKDLPLLTQEEKHQLLVEWNATEASYPKDKTVHELFEEQVQRSPQATALVFEGEQLSYEELNARANRLAHYLREQGVGPEVLVGICVERSLEMVVGLLGILKAGGAYVPLDPSYPKERLAYMLEDAKPRVLLTQERLLGALPQDCATMPLCLDRDWPQIAKHPDTNPANQTRPENLVYVIYTSGSTGRPKGMMVTHDCVARLFSSTEKWFGFNSQDVWTLFHSYAFDFSVWEMWGALLYGGRLIVVPYLVSRTPEKFHALVQREKVTVLNQTPSAFRQFTVIDAEQSAQGSLRLVIFGGEALNFAELRPWFERHGDQHPQLVNMYGITETTVHVTYRPVRREDVEATASAIGRPLPDLQAYVLNEERELQPVGVSGELYIGGDGVGRGYLNRPELTAQKFIGNPFSEDPKSRLYKTGDLARYLPDGNLEYLGRIDHQVKIRGFRIELGEIEATLLESPGVTQAVVQAREDEPGDKRLVAYVVPETGEQLELEALRAGLKKKLPEYMVPSAFVVLEGLPLTPNGKVDRKALPAPDGSRQTSKEYVAPRTPLEQTLADIWAQVLKVDQVGIHDNFFELGGHSLLAVQAVSRLRSELKAEYPLRLLFEHPTVGELAGQIEQGGGAQEALLPAIARASRENDLPLSFAQQRLWFLDRYERNSAFYNIPMALRLQGKLDVASLSLAFNELVRRHETLRTVFGEKEGTPYQLIVPELTLELPLEDLSALEEESRKQEARRRVKEEAAKPFDLAKGPLIRVGLLRLGELEHVLLLTLHHIVSDGWSMGVLFREVATLYEAFAQGKPSPLAELAIQYADYAHWQRQWLQGEVLEGQVNYWKEQLAGAPALLELPTDRPRLALQSYRGATLRFGLPKELTGKLNALAREKGVTLFMLMAAAFKALLHRYTGQEDICIGTAVANRRHAQLEGLIGFFVNTLVLRTKVQGEESFDGLLKRVQETALGAYAHQDLPFEKLVEELNPPRSLSHAPLFQVMLILQNAPRERIESKELSFRAMGSDARVSKFDLTCFLTEGAQRLFGTFEYNTDLFDRATMERLAKHYEVLLEGICQRPQAQLKDLPLLTQEEKHQLLVEWNATEASYPKDKTVHELFEEQVQRSPQATALVFEGEQLSYEELNARANRLAHYLREQGVGPEVLVGICVERSLEMVVGLLGILKAGGAYVPLDPAYPKERLAYMLEDAKPRVLLTQERLLAELPRYEGQRLCLDRDWEERISEQPEANPQSQTKQEDLAYVIYTSGSTGQPKGVGNTVGGLNNRLRWFSSEFDDALPVVMASKTSIGFVDSVTETLGPLVCQGKLIIVRREDVVDAMALARCIEANGITHLVVVPSLLSHLLRTQVERIASLRLVITSGEYLPYELIEEVGRRWPHVRLLNFYGSSEVNGDSTFVECGLQPVRSRSLIGRPIANTQIYILDERLKPVPVGVSGELHIGGAGLARGYLNRPELTAEKFIVNPFGESGSRLYKTGDLARYLPDGNIEYLGRMDNQVKLRGFRIELGEIESVLQQDARVAQAVVLAREDEPGDKRLVAYVVPKKHDSLARESVVADEATTFSLFYFGSNTYSEENKYELYLEAARFADQQGFEAIWTPERHFHEVGSLYPNPSVLNAALSTITNRVGLRAGSVVLPLHDPIRVAEEWAVVDNLSKGRVGVAITSGWHPRDFILSPQNYDSRKQAMQKGIDDLRALWSGRTISRVDGAGKESTIQVFPKPIQPELPMWITCAGNPDTFVQAGRLGANVLTHLLGQTIPEMAKQIELYRKARAEHGHDPQAGKVTVMIHTFMGEEFEQTLERARVPFMQYMRSHLGLLAAFVKSLDIRVPVSGEQDLENIVAFAFERYSRTASLIGTPQTCLPVFNQLKNSGVNEIACLVDWIDTSSALGGLQWLARLRNLARSQGPSTQALRQRLMAKLPEYMVPSAFIVLESLPLMPNGKLDRKALPAPSGERQASKEYVEPRSETEKTLAQIWAKVLKVPKIGLYDNFFELGGHSLLAARSIRNLSQTLNVDVPLRDLFEAPTILRLAEVIEQRQLAKRLLEKAGTRENREAFEF